MNDLFWDILFIILGYLSGSVLYAKLFTRLFGCADGIEQSKDKNPGTANAFASGGFWCGMLTLLCDLAKGAVPVLLYQHFQPDAGDAALALVIAAPAVGHAFPVSQRFHGGKAIAVSFGCLLGLLPEVTPVLSLCFFFILFSTVLVINPHFYRTAVSFICAFAAMCLLSAETAHCAGFLLITLVVCLRLHLSKEERENVRVKAIWMR